MWNNVIILDNNSKNIDESLIWHNIDLKFIFDVLWLVYNAINFKNIKLLSTEQIYNYIRYKSYIKMPVGRMCMLVNSFHFVCV